jgi:spore maturation protein B
MLLRPLSGSGALAEAMELMRRYGPDSLIGRTAAVMLGSSETSFYVIAVYFTAARAREDGRALAAALCADLVCFLSSAWICRLFWG